MNLTKRDRLLIDELSCFGVLSTQQVGDLFFPGIRKTTILRRLRLLEKSKLIRRVTGLPEGKLAWLTTDEGNRAVGSAYPTKVPNRNSLEHDLVLADLRCSLDRIKLWESWTPEHALKAQMPRNNFREELGKERLIPDALIVARRNKNDERTFPTVALELELHAKSRDRYKKILGHYSKLHDLFAVWYFVPTLSLGIYLQGIWNDLPPTYKRKPHFMWTLVMEALEEPATMVDYAEKPALPFARIFEIVVEKPAHPTAQGVSGQTDHNQAKPDNAVA